ncbi:helix-hairpin-helix domain-containing protein [Kitasatospora sp. NPDC001175]|uniref:helix-hairpin-helix domain-containing protein n=1 Tax=Kitasatospora sp. NPDC001175 TaxID=3157103 RepID=UPI003D05D2A1
MRTLTPGAARRRDTTEAVRDRVANLFPTDQPSQRPVPDGPAGSRGTRWTAAPSRPDSPSGAPDVSHASDSPAVPDTVDTPDLSEVTDTADVPGSSEAGELSEPDQPPDTPQPEAASAVGQVPFPGAVLPAQDAASLLRYYERRAAGLPEAPLGERVRSPSGADETGRRADAAVGAPDPAALDPVARRSAVPEPAVPEPDVRGLDIADRVPTPAARLPAPTDAVDRPAGARRRRVRLPSLHSGLALDRRAVLGLTVLLLLAVGYAVQHFWLGRPEAVAIPTTVVTPSPAVAAPGSGGDPSASSPPRPSGAVVVVEVTGKVQHPGLRTLPSGSRVADAVNAAGGPLPDTDTSGVNLARLLTDGEQIVVGAPADQPPPVAAAGPRRPLSLNQATVEQLDTLPGVGPTLAQRIVTFRQEHGGFRSLEQLRQVSGIGARKFSDLRALLTL